ncbi:MAG TPA: type I 3-dehydroquinate dehydratase, partial [Thermoanaerobaculia bacterium]|nr:type I 3-dehydroquinate dehydratase [Thermoanaerobaculia bacterium]
MASLAPRDLADACRLAARVPAGATAVEYRMDLATEPIPPGPLVALDARPAIVTHRTLREGGRFTGSLEEYRRLLVDAYDAGATVDVEHAFGLLDDRAFLPDRRRVLVSLHAPFGLPDDWKGSVAAMTATGARAVKLVASTHDLPAALRVAALQRDAGSGPLAIFPMGPASAPARVLSAFFGSALVFGSVDGDTAPGQLTLEELLDTYGVGSPRPIDALYGIAGTNPSGSLSPRLHNALFRSRGLASLYLPLPVADFERELPFLLENDPPFRGFSVTRPWKLAAARAGSPSDDVRATGAANTLVRARGGWRAENTDVDGVFDPLADHDTGEGRAAVILGAGGAGRAAVVAARRLGYEVALSARRDEEADRIAADLGIDSLAWEDVAASEADLYVNATPAGWKDGDEPAV